MKNRSNEIRSNEIRIRRELPVDIFPRIMASIWPGSNKDDDEDGEDALCKDVIV